MKYELIDKKTLSTELENIKNEKSKKDELKALGFAFEKDDKDNFQLRSFAFEDYTIFSDGDDEIIITISNNGTLVVSKSNKTKLKENEKTKVDAVVKKMYELLGIAEAGYQAVSENPEGKVTKASAGIGTGSANASSPAPLPAKHYHHFLAAHEEALNTALKSHHYHVNLATHTLEKLDEKNSPTGHKITVSEDGSTQGDLFTDFSNTEAIAKNIADDHIAVVKMHLALLKQGIKPDKKINLFLIKQGLTPEQAKLVPEIEEKIKAQLAKAFAEPEYNDIKDFIVYNGVPLTVKKETAKSDPKKAAEPEHEKGFMEKIRAGEDTGNMWLRNSDIYAIARHTLVEALGDARHVIIAGNAENSTTVFDRIPKNSKNYFPTEPRPLYLAMNHGETHFVLVYINDKNELNYINSMRGSNESIEKMLRNKFPGFAKYNVQHLAEQTDGWSCGYRVAREILKQAGLNEHPLVKANSSEEIRDTFVNIAKEHCRAISIIKRPLFSDSQRSDGTQADKLQYYDVSETTNKELYDLIKALGPDNLATSILDLCKSNPQFRHALLETAPHFIYCNGQLDADKSRLGENYLGMALMEARNHLFIEKNPKHPLIVDTGELSRKARKERREVDELLGGAEKTKGKPIWELRNMVTNAKAAKPETDAKTRPPSPGRK